MYVDVLVAGNSGATPLAMIPRTAVQIVGERQVVYLVNPRTPEKFTEREIRVGDGSGDLIPVLAGVQPGDTIVSEGSFFVRAERERLDLRAPADNTPVVPKRETNSRRYAEGTAPQAAQILVNEQGFEPSTLKLRAPARSVARSDARAGSF